jgi:tetratricopeptide (TPR) repeat protein
VNRIPKKIIRASSSAALCAAFFLALCASPPARAGAPNIPPEALHAMDMMYGGDPDGAIVILRALQRSQPENPLPFLLEGEAQWWKIYCSNSDVKYGMVDAWKRGRKPEDESYFVLADKVIDLAQAQISKSDTAEMHLYAGMGHALKVRLYVIRGENRNVAHSGVAARAEFLRALELDPQMADATAGLGLYNYFVDSLSTAVKILRFFMGIPGGDRNEGIQQMQMGIDNGVLTPVEMRFYLARNLRTFDREYQRAVDVGLPLVARYPKNPNFLLLLGNLNTELGRIEKAAEYFHAALKLPMPSSSPDCAACSACSDRVHTIANSFLASPR